jgi:hypothetical protein
METVVLEAFKFSVCEKGSDQELPLGAFDGKSDFLNVLGNYLRRARETVSHDESKKKLWRLDHIKEDNRDLAAGISHGGYGQEMSFYNVVEQKETYRQSRHEAGLMPFYLIARIPENGRHGIMLLEKHGVFSIYTALGEGLRAFFRQAYSDHILNFERLVPDGVIRHMIKTCGVKAVTFTRYKIPPDRADRYGLEASIERAGKMEVRFQASPGGVLPLPDRIQKIIDEQRNLSEITSVYENEADMVSIELKIGKSTKTVNFNNIQNTRVSFEVTDKVDEGKDGWPTFESLDVVAREHLNDLASGIIRYIETE